MRRIKFIPLQKHSLKAVFESLIQLPKKFWKNFSSHILVLLPLILTQLLQKLQDLVDDRYMGLLGKDALTIHNVQYNFFLIGTEVGLAAATSALIFWKRAETKGKQGSVMILHLGLPAVLCLIAAGFFYFFIPELCEHFAVNPEYSVQAGIYLKIGLINLVLRSVYVPINAILIACDQRIKSMIYMGGIMAAKFVLGWIAVNFLWDKSSTPESLTHPMMMVGLSSVIVFSVALVISIRAISRWVDGWQHIGWRTVLKVWPGELGIGAISAISPLLFGFQVAKAVATPGFFVTYQLALHFTYVLTLPVLAGMQIAVRDASAEQSQTPGLQFKPLHEACWWPLFFYASLAPTIILLFIALGFGPQIFKIIYAYEVPNDHRIFLPIFYLAWMFWQIGSVFLIMLRASQKNGLATRNFIVAGFGVQVGITQLLLIKEWATPMALGFIMVGYCGTYMIMNWRTIYQIQSRYYLLKQRAGLRMPHLHLRLPIRKPNIHLPLGRKRREREATLHSAKEQSG